MSSVYPPDLNETAKDCKFGIYPVDFIIETILNAGLTWFRTTPGAPNAVYGHLTEPYLSKYGQAKIDEITDFIKTTEIRIVQHWALIDQTVPNISIQLLDAAEREDRAGLDDHSGDLDIIEDGTGNILGREQLGYVPILDNVHIGIHAVDTPDLVKYLYYLVIYILMAFKPQLQERGIQLSTFRVTDLSRMNDYLPNNMYSRFINFSVYTTSSIKKGELPILEEILGIHLRGEDDGTIDEINGGITVSNVEQSDGE
jgi:hypothetical protein